MNGRGGEWRTLAAPGYLDFEVEVGEGRRRAYPVAVRSPAGGTRATMRFPFDQEALKYRLLVVENALLRGVGLRRQLRTEEEQTVEDFGRTLFEALLPGEALNRYDVSLRMAREQDRGLRLRLNVLDAALTGLPWELLYDPRRGDYLCLSPHTPLVRHLEVAQPAEALTIAPPLRILGMVASPRDQPALDVEGERRRVAAALGGLPSGLVELEWLEGQSWEALQEALWPPAGPWHVFHFVGHGGFDPHAGEGHLALTAEAHGGTYRLSATALGRLLTGHDPLRLVVLNSCEGARGSGRDLFSGTAATLVRMGLPAVVAMQYAITDRAAIEFARTFYRALGRALPADAAVGAARQAVSAAAPTSLEWAIPVLYLRAPDAVLFRPGLPSLPSAAQSDGAPLTAPSGFEAGKGTPAAQAERPLVAAEATPPPLVVATIPEKHRVGVGTATPHSDGSDAAGRGDAAFTAVDSPAEVGRRGLQFGLIFVSVLIDGAFFWLWIIVQSFVHEHTKGFLLGGVDAWMVPAFRYTFAATTLAPVLAYAVFDIVKLAIRLDRSIRRLAGRIP